MDRGAWKATVHRMGKSRTRQSDLACTHTHTHTHTGTLLSHEKEGSNAICSVTDGPRDYHPK